MEWYQSGKGYKKSFTALNTAGHREVRGHSKGAAMGDTETLSYNNCCLAASQVAALCLLKKLT